VLSATTSQAKQAKRSTDKKGGTGPPFFMLAQNSLARGSRVLIHAMRQTAGCQVTALGNRAVIEGPVQVE
jgi:hypothetical protein